ncbi:MAG TPA: hypothetical protein DCZ91_22650 [Lachnospiraceae bacterium]|nr:hypothetical protein [Lachnospiraceae bacterium]
MINELNISIWERAFLLPVEYDCYDDEVITDAQKSAVKMLAMHPEWIVSAKEQVERFCREEVLVDSENNKKDNIFSYIKPDYLFVKRDDHPRVAIMCKYRYDIEHGLAVVFSADGNISVGPQDIIL